MRFYKTIHYNRTVVGKSRANECRAELARALSSAAEIAAHVVLALRAPVRSRTLRGYPITRHAASLPEMPHFVIFDTPLELLPEQRNRHALLRAVRLFLGSTLIGCRSHARELLEGCVEVCA